MKKMLLRVPVFLIGTFFSSFSLFAQTADVSVDNFTGRAVVSIPLCVLRSGDVTLPVSLAYGGAGIKVKDAEGSAGIGWNLSAGGEIRREVKGLPDDLKLDDYMATRTGWLYNNNGNLINNFVIANGSPTSTCIDGGTDLAYLEGNFSNLSDTEPDVFYVNAPGLHCQMVLDKDTVFRVMPYQDLKITYKKNVSTDSSNGRITGFTITTDNGFAYYFSTLEISNRTSLTSMDPVAIKFFKREYEQYKNGIDYVSAWQLTSIRDYKGNTIDLSYLSARSRSTNSRIDLTAGTDDTKITPYFIRLTSGQNIPIDQFL